MKIQKTTTPCRRRDLIAAPALMAMFGFTSLLHAQEQTLTPEQIVRRMRPVEPDDGPIVTKGFEVHTEAPVGKPQPVKVPNRPIPTSAASGGQSASLSGDFNEITFEFGSARLTSAGTELMSKFVTAFRSPELAALNLKIIGHTDAVGSDDSNMRLSILRAQAVVREMVKQGFDSRRLRYSGMGKRQLLYPDRPTDAGNRRVQIQAFKA